MAITRDATLDWMNRFAGAMSEHREELVKLDTAIGDGDHGTNMNRGMTKAMEKLAAAEQAAEEGMNATTPMIARKGRASYLGERSKDHQDPGATSTYYLFKSATEALAD